MDFFEVISRRYSVRAYRSDPVEEEKLLRILEAARLAPTAANRQAFQILVIPTAGREGRSGAAPLLSRIYGAAWFTQAPLVLGVCTFPKQAWTRKDGKNYADVDAAIVMDHIVLAATALGLGTCWVAAFDPAAAREVLGLPPEVEPVAFTPLGYPADSPKPKKRKELSELVRYGRW